MTRPDKKRRPRRKPLDPARQAAFDVLRAVSERDAYANLALPAILRERGITGLDAAFATELTYGTCRSQGLLDAVIAAAAEHAVQARIEVAPHLVEVRRSVAGAAAFLRLAVVVRVASPAWIVQRQFDAESF